MSMLTILLTILGYWIGMGVFMIALMFLFYMIAVFTGDMAEWLKAASC
jgi:membrane protein DedA with SNARE-associated domain